MHYVLFGGEDVKKRTGSSTHKKYMNQKKVLIIPWSGPDMNKKGKYRKIMKKYFLDCGAESVTFLERQDKKKEIIKKVEHSQVIYLPGGYTDDFLRSIKRRKYLPELLKNYKGVISGNSAGTNIIAENYVNYNNKTYTLKKGLGLLKITVMVHYNESEEEKTRELELRRRVKIKRIGSTEALIV